MVYCCKLTAELFYKWYIFFRTAVYEVSCLYEFACEFNTYTFVCLYVLVMMHIRSDLTLPRLVES